MIVLVENKDPSVELAAIREKVRMNIRRFAEELGVTESRYKNWEYGRTKKVPDTILTKARRLGARMLGEPESSNAIQITNKRLVDGFTTIVLVRSWSCGSASVFADEDCVFEKDSNDMEIPSAFLAGSRDINDHDIVRIAGRSMAPLIQPADRVLFYRDKVHKKNTIVMAEDPEGCIRIKVLRDVNNHWELHSIHEDGATYTDLTDWKVYGYAVTIMRDMDEPGPNITWPFGQPIKV